MTSATPAPPSIGTTDAAGDRPAVASPSDSAAADAEDFRLFKDIVRALPAAVTVQDEEGRFIFVNDAAAAQYRLAPTATDAVGNLPLERRRNDGAALLAEGQAGTREERLTFDGAARALLTAHKPVDIAGRKLLLSSSLDVTEQKVIEDELFRRAYYDELTGLPNRAVIEHHVTALIEDHRSQHFALAFLDVDNFKHINDYYGHSVGDALLVGIAKRLSLELRDTDVLSRISGDEFLLLLDPVTSENEVADHVEFLLQRLKAPFYIDGTEVFASASIGISLYPDHGSSYEALRQNADIAMYRVKSDAKGALAIFNVAMEREALARMAVEQSLRQAILDKRFCCAFQPKVDIRTNEIKGIEALVRLRDDNGVIQAPGTFVDLAVELGLIDELTHLVLGEIMKSIDLINAAFGEHASISVNVAAKQAGSPEFMRSFCEALAATECPTRFMIEVTEDAFVAKAHFQQEILPMLRKIGVGISIDDFGIGYSSLSALADITADEIKIDRSFITDIHKRPRSQGILRAIESLSDALGMTVIAEGIETFEELAYLQAMTRIRYAQGYYYSKPIFLEELRPTVPAFTNGRPDAPGRQVENARQPLTRATFARR
ncbi:diguanylate cyclase [Rhodopseudomonas palustris]|uniref:Diguanylate cyclase n=1 Tax=Rhodopseudomonas palustris TaxID=1076 RepID=A0A323UGB8_RHOPL|nr:EAL domain-containing protein [Rhodopseudomonas palustris]PZA11409.1 diguanylate cyclase [Rhodopseudomonas palustris]